MKCLGFVWTAVSDYLEKDTAVNRCNEASKTSFHRVSRDKILHDSWKFMQTGPGVSARGPLFWKRRRFWGGGVIKYRIITLTHSRTHALTHSRTHALTHSRTHALTHSRTHALTHSRTHALTHSRTHALTHSRTHALCWLLWQSKDHLNKQ